MEPLAKFLQTLQHLLRRKGETRERAEDLVQEAYLRMQVYCKEGGTIVQPEAFLTRAAMNLAIDTDRRAHRDLYSDDCIEDLELIDLGPSPDEILVAEERLTLMWNALNTAGERTRQAFFLHRLHGYSYAEIAKRLHVSISTVEKDIARALTMVAIGRQE